MSACENYNTKIITPKNSTDIKVLKKGFDILDSNCFSCHNIDKDKVEMIAPTMASVKLAYSENNSKEGFIEDLANFVSEPNAEKAKMHKEIKKYGLMPKMGYSKEQLIAVAEYLYSQNIESEKWYVESYSNEKKKYKAIKSEVSYLEKGQKLAMKTKSTLGKNLMGTIKKKGTDEALTFCNLKAYSLVDSMATLLNASITRVSDKPRNANNEAIGEELVYIKKAKDLLKNGEKIKAQIKEKDGKMLAYYPIMTNKMCLQCHGEVNTQIKESTMTLINKFYPEDKATGYKENELRAIWKIVFEK